MKFKRITELSLLLSILVLFGSVSYAWLSVNRIVEQKNILMNLENDDTTASYSVYKYNIKQGLGKNTDDKGNLLTISDVDFNPYDLIFTSRNRYTPVFARVEVKQHSSMPKSGTINLTITRKLDNNDSVSSELSKYSSSLIRFTAKVDNTYDENPNTLYTAIDEVMYGNTKNYVTVANDTSAHDYDDFSKTFLTVQKSGNDYTFTKSETITLVMTYDESNWSIIDGNETLNIYLYMTYDEGLIDLYKKTSNLKIEVGNKNIIDFENDFDTIKVSYQGGTVT